MKDLTGRTAVVVGGGGGIGGGTALALAREGMHVAVADIDLPAAMAVQERIRHAGLLATAFEVDGVDAESLTQLADCVLHMTGSIHLLANNVGAQVHGRLDAVTEADWMWGLEFNLMATVRAVRVFLPHLRSQGGPGHIINNTTVGTLFVYPSTVRKGIETGVYSATKWAVMGYSEVLRSELQPEGIGVSVLVAGKITSDFARTTALRRPDRFGGPYPTRPPQQRTVPQRALSGDEAGRIIVEGIKEDRFHIVTHPEYRADVEDRNARVLEDFSFFHQLIETDRVTHSPPDPSPDRV